MGNARNLADNLPMTGATGSRNLIINGNMKVAQRGTSSTVTNGFGTADRFRIWHGAVGNVASNQYSGTTNAVDGVSNYSFRAQATNTASLVANSDAHIRYVVEDKDIENIGITNPNNNFTLSFYVKCSNAGQSSIGITTGDFSGARYVVPYTIASADTWQRVELTFPGNAAAYNPTSGFGLRIYWDLGIGTNYQTSTHNQWITSGSAFAAAGNLQIIGVYDRWLQITGVQLEHGSKATPFEHEPYSTTLTKCRRYTFVHQTNVNYAWGALSGYCNTTSNALSFYQYPIEMRTSPSIAVYGDWQICDGHTCYPISSMQVGTMSPITARIDVAASGLTVGRVAAVRNLGNAASKIVFDAEL